MEYTEILKEMISSYNSDLENALAGNIQKYCYKEMNEKKFADYLRKGLEDYNRKNEIDL
jgi:hypothetical protein